MRIKKIILFLITGIFSGLLSGYFISVYLKNPVKDNADFITETNKNKDILCDSLKIKLLLSIDSSIKSDLSAINIYLTENKKNWKEKFGDKFRITEIDKSKGRLILKRKEPNSYYIICIDGQIINVYLNTGFNS